MKNFIIILFCSVFFILSCSPRDFVRNNEFFRNLFYPKELQSDFVHSSGLGENTKGESFDHYQFEILLDKYVDMNGMVNYIALETEEEILDSYLDSLTRAQYEKLTRYEKLAFLINAYNAFTLRLILQNPGIKSIKDIPSDKRWKNEVWQLAGKRVSLDFLEHDWIRKKFGEPKIHFALVCAAKSCPKLRHEPYEGEKLKGQLNDQASHFFTVKKNFQWDPQKKEVQLSAILDWFRYDFAEDEIGVLEYSLKYIDSERKRAIKSSMDSLKIKYISYDWSLNGNWK